MILESEKRLYRRLLPMMIENQIQGRERNEGSTVQTLTLRELKSTFEEFSKTDNPILLMSNEGIYALGEYLKKYEEAKDLFNEAELEKIWKVHKVISKVHERDDVFNPVYSTGSWSNAVNMPNVGFGSSVIYSGTSATSSNVPSQGTLFPGQATPLQSATQEAQAELQRKIAELKAATKRPSWSMKSFFDPHLKPTAKRPSDDGLEKDPEDNADEHD